MARRQKKLAKQSLPDRRDPIADFVEHLPGTASPAERIQSVVSQQHFSGPIPPPEIFRQYGEIIPDAPERILRVFEDDSKHAREIAFAALNAQKGDNRRAHWMAWSLITIGMCLVAFLAYIDKDILAGVVAGSTLVAIATGFLQAGKATSANDL
ncbi:MULTISPECIES: DUF2335 domain-containing protein [Methylocaldum]|jgi:uncharacterized membrane protein|uniref:DUF2335 domain-containing protein n=1 Tax=Methylocaldum sp. 14B TaxID=1912213 RepID=UPI00098ABDD9|nr:DUF2335 domain-containing protein [Methylocaldum sp. 14B]MVF20573.1 DUF2335 domain-containing protein [Methylocaldum sp. BRCS4]